MNDFFRDLVEEIKDKDTSILSDGKAAGEWTGLVDTGCYILNAVLSGSLYGGVPNNRITGFAGEEATGKTFFALAIVKHFLESNPNAGVVYFDTESAINAEMMAERGIDPERVIISEPITVQDFRHKAIKFVDAYMEKKDPPPMMFVLDSLGMLSTTKELEDTKEGKETKDMTRAQIIKAAFRVLTLKMARAKIPMILTNHVYAAVGAYVPTKEMGGGSGAKYAASSIAFLSKSKDKDGTDVIGNYITVYMYKSRLSIENKKVKIRLSYTKGLDKYYGLRDLAEKYGIFKKVSTRIELPDGRKVFGKTIDDNPEEFYTPEIMALLEEAAQREFSYGDYSEELTKEELAELEEIVEE